MELKDIFKDIFDEKSIKNLEMLYENEKQRKPDKISLTDTLNIILSAREDLVWKFFDCLSKVIYADIYYPKFVNSLNLSKKEFANIISMEEYANLKLMELNYTIKEIAEEQKDKIAWLIERKQGKIPYGLRCPLC